MQWKYLGREHEAITIRDSWKCLLENVFVFLKMSLSSWKCLCLLDNVFVFLTMSFCLLYNVFVFLTMSCLLDNVFLSSWRCLSVFFTMSFCLLYHVFLSFLLCLSVFLTMSRVLPQAFSKRRRVDATKPTFADENDDEERLHFETEETEEEKDWISCLKVASVLRDGKERVVQVNFTINRLIDWLIDWLIKRMTDCPSIGSSARNL